MKKDATLEGEDDVKYTAPKEIIEFIKEAPGMKIDSKDVTDVKADEFEQLQAEHERMMERMENDKVEVQRQMELQRADMARKVEAAEEARKREEPLTLDSELSKLFPNAAVPPSNPDVDMDCGKKLLRVFMKETEQDVYEARVGERLIDAEIEKLTRLDEEQRKVLNARRHIQENILTLKCPRCAQAFLDFTGCFALTCSHCGCGFCAWCLKDCGRDAHDHVRDCGNKPRGADTFFGSFTDFEEAMKRRQRDSLRAYLQTLDHATREAVKRDLGNQLQGLV